MLKDLNDFNPGSEKRFELNYLNVETRQVTVYAKTVEEAYIKATKKVEARHKTGWVSGFRFDNVFKIRYVNVLNNHVKRWKGAPWGTIVNYKAFTGNDLQGVELGPELLDNNSQAA